MNAFAMLVRRELWEHANVWRIPAILLGLAVLANLAFAGSADWLSLMPAELSSQLVGGTLRSLGPLLYLAFALLSVFYLADSLHAERQDKSILFWRSLPASDLATVLAKLFVGAVIVPLMLWLTVITVQSVSLALQPLLGRAVSLSGALAPAALLDYWLALAGALCRATLWTLPLYAWVLFCSSWTRRTPLLAAAAIPAGLVLLERLLGLDLGLYALIRERLPSAGALAQLLIADGGFGAGRDGAFWQSPFWRRPALGGGLALAALLVAATVWTRRWRDGG